MLKAVSKPMLTVAPFLAAMTIAGAFWVGLIAARRLREWGECQDALEGEPELRALAPAAGASPEGPVALRVRTQLAHAIDEKLKAGGWTPSELAPRGDTAVSWEVLRRFDIVILEGVSAPHQGDYLLESMLHLRETGHTSYVLGLSDAGRAVTLVAQPNEQSCYLLEEVRDHGLSGEPPRHLTLPGAPEQSYALLRRGQASVVRFGPTHRPEAPRLSFYIYRSGAGAPLWVERWGHEVRVFAGEQISEHSVRFLPGSKAQS